jgi:hypothetical protein
MDHDGTLSSASGLLHTVDKQHTVLGQVSRPDGHERLLIEEYPKERHLIKRKAR